MLTGFAQLSPMDTLKESSTQELPLGTIGMTKDGRAYRYAQAGGTALAAGKINVAATQVANHENIAVADAAAVGDTEITVTLGATAASANDYAGGYAVVNDAAGEGQAYAISGHPAADASASLVLKLTDAVETALTTSSEVSLIKNPWKDVVVSVADQADMAVGVAPIAVTAEYYFWCQTRGVCSALADETLAVGKALTIGSSVVGALEVVDTAGEPQIATAIQAGVDTEYRAVYLQID